jgi:bifunctional UDP-N-acetylglucosamine pyrophosphorylase/glucosamine-1-phosphate N-acetyltransferase
LSELACIILAAGKGTRMKSALPKVLHRVAGRPMISHVVLNAAQIGADRITIVVGPDMPEVAEAVKPHKVAIQHERNGTADAVKAARAVLGEIDGDVLITYGDMPLIPAHAMQAMVEERRKTGAAIVVLGVTFENPPAFGRLVLGRDGTLEKIVEVLDASADEKAIKLCNSGLMCVEGKHLWPLIEAVKNENAKGEFYLTDIVALARARGLVARVVEGEPNDLLGVNSRTELAVVEAEMQNRLRAKAMENGATLIDPASVFFSMDTKIGRDVVIGPNVVFGQGVTIADHVEIHAFCHIEGARVESGARIGPFARLRPGAAIGEDAHVGNFVEVKNATLGKGAKANHLSYIGDASIGAKANIGAGTITCNYDGFLKYRTVIGEGAFIGSNSALVAPVSIGDGAIVGAGSVVVADVPADAIATARGEQQVRERAAGPWKARKAAQKAAKTKG